MQLVRAHEVLGLLRDFAVARGGQELRRDRRVQDVQKDLGLGRVSAGVRHIAHEVAHQRLGHARVDGVHGHVVAVVGGPAQRQLGEVAGADDHAALLVGHVHEDLRALAGLGVLVGDVVDGLVVPDVGEVLAHGRADDDLAQLHAERLREQRGVVVRAIRGAKARHGDGDDAAAVEAQQIEGAHGHEQRERGVEAAGDADDGRARARVREALGEAVGLDGKDVLAALRTTGGVGRHEGVRVHPARERGLAGGGVRAQREGHGHVADLLGRGGALEGGHARALLREEADVDL